MRMTFRGAAASEKARAGGVIGLHRATEFLLGESNKLVPIEEGTLQRSGVADVDEATLTAAVSYDTAYAVRQHEDLSYRHDPGRQAKYLEQPSNAERGVLLGLVGDGVRGELE